MCVTLLWTDDLRSGRAPRLLRRSHPCPNRSQVRRASSIGVLNLGAALLLAACGVGNSASTATSQRSRAARRSAPTVPFTTVTTQAPISYQVRRGDTLTNIAKFFRLDPSTIALTNHLANGDQLTVNQTLLIPPRPPTALKVSPASGAVGQAFTLTVTGALSTETITFEVDGPNNAKFTGPPHTADENGSVTATYQTSALDPPGVYTAIGRGDKGTTPQATFRVLVPPPNS